MSTSLRQGRISGWLKMNQSSIKELADSCGKSIGAMSRYCNASGVPTKVRAAMQAFETSSGKHIPILYLPEGRDKKPGPKKGWIDRKLADLRLEMQSKSGV
ncbi:hypothetical protein GO013_16335 [Pseudodesulfovibrio sp. JC047]|uniref:hypothetical protein n=1 Tax=Pseudodesulfovibrio sp. JC047 TaxID=2683199 RepID=UPI0013D8D89C|nr:hypothetical protein [Pseudodesulfovibrio sp. JC047]NDV20981.1 hypothetical protein [Pseudodesulfovibrio sp. JC047]